MRNRLVTIVPFALALAAVCGGARSQQTAEHAEGIRYGRDIRPLLSDRCFLCHGPDRQTRAAGLRLDERPFAIAARDDGAAIVPGDPEASLLLARVRHQDPGERMPPPDSHKAALNPDEIALVERWIAAGAPYEEHWSFVPAERPDVPPGAEHPVDAFLLDAMRARGVAPTPPADRATLARRLYLVLTGLPPTPAEHAEFVEDRRPDAYERLVERLLTEEPYVSRHAEHLAGLWLDAGRYADTSGIHMDAGRQAHLWRDWLIEALRTDKPFDEFVVEQLAGDLLPEPTPDQLVATGFLRNHVTTDEGGAIDAEYLVEYAAERTETVGSVFLGLTVGCARCHDHKYDPITQQDYFRLFSFFNNNQEPGLYTQQRDAFRALEPNLRVPTDEQLGELERLRAEIAAAEQRLDDDAPGERAVYLEFLQRVGADLGLHWTRPAVREAKSTGGAVLEVLRDGSVLAGGDNPATDRHVLTFETHATDQRLLCLEALPHESLPMGRIGRASNGNAVLTNVQVEARALGSDAPFEAVALRYAIADVEQQNGDFGIGNTLDAGSDGWAVAGHEQPGPRAAWFLTEQPFGHRHGTELRVTLAYDSRYGQHVLGRVRLSTSKANDSGLARLPLWSTGYDVCGPFEADGKQALYDTAFGPESLATLDRSRTFGKRSFQYRDNLARDATNPLQPQGAKVHFVAQRVFVPDHRRVEFAIGSDDGFQLYVDGRLVGENRVDRAVALAQDKIAVDLAPGPHLVVLKVVNTGGAGGFALQPRLAEQELGCQQLLALLPDATADGPQQARLRHAWRIDRSPTYRERTERIAALRTRVEEVDRAVPMAMVMQERDTMRPTFVLTRGEYDKADPERPVARELPEVFGSMPDDLPKNRLGLARWLVADDNPLVRRVAVNRLWEFVFGTGIVRTSEDFGRQGEWPSHPDLLDWLACRLRDNGDSVRDVLRLLVTSEAFRRQGSIGPAAAIDPEDRLLTWFPRRRLTAEMIRDQALYVSGLLVERVGGRSVKPYQPPALWREVAMLQSNTRIFERDSGDALWRRSLYTYWKRACPPPSLLTFDAPTREFCTIRRSTTNTPLQALVLWNDEQFVEAARALATRAMHAADSDDQRVAEMFRLATCRDLDADQLERALATLRDCQRRYRSEPDAATQLLQVGETAVDATLPAPDLAAFTLLASAFLDLDATIFLD